MTLTEREVNLILEAMGFAFGATKIALGYPLPDEKEIDNVIFPMFLTYAKTMGYDEIEVEE